MTGATPLLTRLQAQIALSGPISIADYMAICLLDPDHGYYTTRQPFGASGDFVTAPEVSQLFGEIIGAWLIHTWHVIGEPSPFVLVEFGPGRGTLMKDILRTARVSPGFNDAVHPVLIEASERLRGVQAQTLGGDASRVTWHDGLDDLPDMPTLMVSNEFFDALPFRQFVKSGTRWLERTIGIAPDGGLRFQTGINIADRTWLPPDVDADAEPDGAVLEVSLAREAVAADMARHICARGGAALHIDYGHDTTGFGDTFQAVRNNQYADLLAAPGQADLTSHVDFQALANAASAAGAKVSPVMAQGAFLLGCGLLERAGALGRGQAKAQQARIEADVQRLAGDGKDDMGGLFKVLCFAAPARPPLPPFGSN
ncbi:MAG: class I SAM-dependent methyltransferase [Pseudomonadota bacterium]